MEDRFEINSRVFKALSDSNRLRIMDLLSDGEKCACEILKSFDISQSTLSHHMKILSECGLVKCRKEGTWNHYSLNLNEANKVMLFFMETITNK
ncbi:ArsR/SmtB family transcription factor [Clostridium sp. B9]|uniref:ArsR/SmtB family transcription factor n=1 Tax=Clostridium sp. B9 TaxID=3423224 RepID=UPI003D2F2252